MRCPGCVESFGQNKQKAKSGADDPHKRAIKPRYPGKIRPGLGSASRRSSLLLPKTSSHMSTGLTQSMPNALFFPSSLASRHPPCTISDTGGICSPLGSSSELQASRPIIAESCLAFKHLPRPDGISCHQDACCVITRCLLLAAMLLGSRVSLILPLENCTTCSITGER